MAETEEVKSALLEVPARETRGTGLAQAQAQAHAMNAINPSAGRCCSIC